MRADGVVPSAVPGIADDREVFHLPVADLDAGRVGAVSSWAVTVSPVVVVAGAKQIDDRLVAGQGPAAPVPGDLGEQAVLDFVPVAGTGRQGIGRALGMDGFDPRDVEIMDGGPLASDSEGMRSAGLPNWTLTSASR
jgi:hypothetical protein